MRMGMGIGWGMGLCEETVRGVTLSVAHTVATAAEAVVIAAAIAAAIATSSSSSSSSSTTATATTSIRAAKNVLSVSVPVPVWGVLLHHNYIQVNVAHPVIGHRHSVVSEERSGKSRVVSRFFLTMIITVVNDETAAASHSALLLPFLIFFPRPHTHRVPTFTTIHSIIITASININATIILKLKFKLKLLGGHSSVNQQGNEFLYHGLGK